LEEKAGTLASQGEWVSFIDVLAPLVFGTVLFLNVDWLVELAVIDAFLAYHHNKESPVIVVLVHAYDTFDLRCEKSSVRIVCCMPALYVWLVSHVFNHRSRSVCPLQGHHMCLGKDKTNWEELLAGMTEANIKILQRICKACNKVGRKDKELWGRSNGVIGGYHK